METAEEKLSFLANNTARSLSFDEVQPDKTHNWVNLTSNDFDTLLPLASKDTKAAKTAGKERAIFKLFSLGVVTNRDEWVYDDEAKQLAQKVGFLIDAYNADLEKLTAVRGNDKLADLLDSSVKWTRAVKNDLSKGISYSFNLDQIIEAMYRPFVKRVLYFSSQLNEMRYQTPLIFGDGSVQNRCIVFTDPTAQKPWMISAVDQLPDLHFVGAAAGTLCFPLGRLGDDNTLHDNITDWALKQFRQHYEQPISPVGAGGGAAPKPRRAGMARSYTNRQGERIIKSPKKPSSTTATPCCTIRCTAKNTR
jgi:predicted helicase